jgi:hypothetical protein
MRDLTEVVVEIDASTATISIVESARQNKAKGGMPFSAMPANT